MQQEDSSNLPKGEANALPFGIRDGPKIVFTIFETIRKLDSYMRFLSSQYKADCGGCPGQKWGNRLVLARFPPTGCVSIPRDLKRG